MLVPLQSSKGGMVVVRLRGRTPEHLQGRPSDGRFESKAPQAKSSYGLFAASQARYKGENTTRPRIATCLDWFCEGTLTCGIRWIKDDVPISTKRNKFEVEMLSRQQQQPLYFLSST